MKKLIILSLILISFTGVNAQNAKQDATGNYIALNHSQDSSKATKTGRTFTDSKGIVYDVFESKNGKLFYNRISKNTGNPYRAYLKL